MATFPENTLSRFTTLLPQLRETENNECGSSHEIRKNKRKRKPYGMITMYVPPTLPIKEKFIEKVRNIKPGVYVSIDQIMR